MYNSGMDKKTLTLDLNRRAGRIWGELCELRPALVRFNEPVIQLNARFTRTAGRCFLATRKVDMGLKFIQHSRAFHVTMLTTVLPHELIHQADFDLYGVSEKSCCHGAQWAKLMVEYGLEPRKYHSMDLKC